MTLPANTGFPTNIPDPFGQTPNGKVTYTGLKSTRYRFNMGAGFYDTGIPTINPPAMTAGAYQVETLVPMCRWTVIRSIRASRRRPTATATTSPA